MPVIQEKKQKKKTIEVLIRWLIWDGIPP